MARRREPSAQGRRLAELAMQVRAGKFDALKRIVVAQGGSWDALEDGTQVARGVLCSAGFSPGLDPCTALVQVGFALFGACWAQIPAMGEAMQIVNSTKWVSP